MNTMKTLMALLLLVLTLGIAACETTQSQSGAGGGWQQPSSTLPGCNPVKETCF